MPQKTSSFSLLELIATIVIVSILSAIAIPSYKTHVINIKISQIFTTLDYYKLNVIDAFANKELINKSITNPIDLITKLSLKTLNTKPTYIIQAAINTKKLNIDIVSCKPLLINLIGTLQDDFLIWKCQIQDGYALHTPESCIAMELNFLED